MSDLWQTLTPRSAAIILLVPEGFPERVLRHLQLHEPGRVIHTSLGDELEAALEAARREP